MWQSLFTQFNVDLPHTHKFICKKREEYEKEGYACLVDWPFGKKLAAMVKNDLSASVLGEMISNFKQYDDSMGCFQYNKWAKANGYRLIEPATVGVWRRNKQAFV